MKRIQDISIFMILILAGIMLSFKPVAEKPKPYAIVKIWDLPGVLDEVSGLSWAGNDQILMVEDEHATLYLYDLEAEKLEKEISFGENGDFEGVALDGSTAFAMRSDGMLFEIQQYLAKNPKVKNYRSALSHKNNVETLAIDKQNHQLLFAPKDEDPNDDQVKGIYSFDLDTHKMQPEELFKIDMLDRALKDYKEKKTERTFRPSDLAVHPQTGAFYVLEGVHPKLLILNTTGDIKRVIDLDEKHFPQPEGITFSPDGRLFISNEGHGQPATVVEIRLSE